MARRPAGRTDGQTDMQRPTLPQDIMLLICQELGARREFATLYRCSMVSRRIASIAVEQLYSIMEVMDPFIEDRRQAVQLWRSIILSSRGATLYPYCAYIRVLSLSSLSECLDDIRYDWLLRNFFFQGLMQDFLVLQGDSRLAKVTRSRPLPFDNSAITSRCVDSITRYIKGLADNNGTAVALTHLEAFALPRDTLPTWIGRLGTLTSLRLRDGSVLDVKAAVAIAECCPSFAELTCFNCSSDTAAEDMAAFFLALRPNSLQRFEVLSQNSLGDVTLSALNNHAQSLKVLHLRSLLHSAIKSLHLLSECTALESLVIERETLYRSVLDALSEEEFARVARWISSCKSLRELNLNHLQDALPVLKQVLQASAIRLEQLLIQDYQPASRELTEATWRALGQQDRLELLTIASQDGSPEGLVLAHHPELTDSICHLFNLTSLNLMQAWVSSPEICRIATSLPRLEELSFGGDLVDESILLHLSKLPKLVLLSINAVTAFTFGSLRDFAKRLDPVANRGIKVDLLNQWYEAKLTEDEDAWLNDYFADNLNGRIAISYPNDPDELHEADFSDSE
ncbi:hypothetical protein F5B18DRAFT_388489 [Nemania serpens]|nr:hypothetical protein F5B18DRAFT_388489 [Nemania serpens]